MPHKDSLPKVCLYFQAHQPLRLKPYDFFKLGSHESYENADLNKDIIHKVSERCYRPANQLFQNLLEKYPEQFAVSYSLTGTLLEQLRKWEPETLSSFQALSKERNVELLAETYYHSVACTVDDQEFCAQVLQHHDLIEELFQQSPRTFRNTELIFSNHIAILAESMGYDQILCEDFSSQKNTLRRPQSTDEITAIPRSLSFSDDVAFRFSDKSWEGYPLNSEKFVHWIKNSGEEFINIFIDYETLGEHQSAESGIFSFWEGWITEALQAGIQFMTPSQLAETITHREPVDCHVPTSWADTDKDLSAWNGNILQREAIHKVFRLHDMVSEEDRHTWRGLGTSDHFYYMSTKEGSDGEVHEYFSPFPSPYDAYIYYMNILADFQIHLKQKEGLRAPSEQKVTALGR